jgi:hypothetical protein
MTFAGLDVGDHFLWPLDDKTPLPDSLNVNIKIARSDDGGGFAIDLATREDCCIPGVVGPGGLQCWIPGSAPVIKLNGRL